MPAIDKKVEMGERAVARYKPDVLQGNWYEESYKIKEELLNFIHAMKEGKLMYQYAGDFYSKHEQQVTISPPNPHVFYGDRIMIMNPLLESKQPKDETEKYTGISAAVIFHTQDYIRSPEIFPGMYVGGSGDITPTMRNTFYITSIKENKNGEKLCYGECFTFSLRNTFANRTLYLEGLPAHHISGPLGYSQKMRVSLVPDYSVYCRWKIVHLDPKARFASRDKPVPTNENLLIVHASTNQNLCILNYWFPTVFGQECEVTTETKEDIFKRPHESNVWQIRSFSPTGTWGRFKEHVESRNAKNQLQQDVQLKNPCEQGAGSNRML